MESKPIKKTRILFPFLGLRDNKVHLVSGLSNLYMGQQMVNTAQSF